MSQNIHRKIQWRRVITVGRVGEVIFTLILVPSVWLSLAVDAMEAEGGRGTTRKVGGREREKRKRKKEKIRN